MPGTPILVPASALPTPHAPDTGECIPLKPPR